MISRLKISSRIQAALRCPCCEARLRLEEKNLTCCNASCETIFPVVDGIPVLINEAKSLFSIGDFTSKRETTFHSSNRKIARFVQKLIPSTNLNVRAKENFRELAGLLKKRSARPTILVLGGSISGEGFEIIANDPEVELIDSDVSFGPRTMLICDAHDIPFEDGVFDAVVVQAVLEHVTDPFHCVAEIHRVLNKEGIVYAETPFMQQVHMGCFDFTRFTHLGHRRLFRNFAEIDSGVVCGPAMALSWAYRYFLLSFATSKAARFFWGAFASFTSFYLKYLDYLLVRKPGALDAASGYFFLGQKASQLLSDRELIRGYAGLQK